MMDSSTALIIPAAGAGKRMQRDTAKPYIELQGKPVLAHTLNRFLAVSGLQQILIAASTHYLEEAREIMKQTAGDSIPWRIVEGGATRQQSIHHAIKALETVSLVMVHDAVRPFVTKELIERCCRKAQETGAAVPGFPCNDTIKEIDDNNVVRATPDRSHLWQIQTPQVFKRELIEKAYNHASEQGFQGTDDASLVEWLGEPVSVVKGSSDNFKITYPRDLQLADFQLTEANIST